MSGTVLLFCIAFTAQLWAGEAALSTPYSGNLLTRTTLSGDWGGLRNGLAAKGVTIDMSLTQSAQGIVHGGKDTGWQYSGGRGDIILNLDTQKLGLWPGGFFNLEAEGNFIPADNLRKSINGRTGALMYVNNSQIYPTTAGDNFNLPAINFTQYRFTVLRFDDRQVCHNHLQLWRYERVCPWQGRHAIHEYGIQCESGYRPDRALFHLGNRGDRVADERS